MNKLLKDVTDPYYYLCDGSGDHLAEELDIPDTHGWTVEEVYEWLTHAGGVLCPACGKALKLRSEPSENHVD